MEKFYVIGSIREVFPALLKLELPIRNIPSEDNIVGYWYVDDNMIKFADYSSDIVKFLQIYYTKVESDNIPEKYTPDTDFVRGITISDVVIDTKTGECGIVEEIDEIYHEPYASISIGSSQVLKPVMMSNLRLASKKEVDTYNEDLHKFHRKHLSLSKRKFVPWFEMYDRIVGLKDGEWVGDVFKQYDKVCQYHYICFSGRYSEIVGYKEFTNREI